MNTQKSTNAKIVALLLSSNEREVRVGPYDRIQQTEAGVIAGGTFLRTIEDAVAFIQRNPSEAARKLQALRVEKLAALLATTVATLVKYEPFVHCFIENEIYGSLSDDGSEVVITYSEHLTNADELDRDAFVVPAKTYTYVFAEGNDEPLLELAGAILDAC